jgi:predicted MFS family arabinose efflux permease
MTKQWLEFFGGLFVFLGALVPVFRAAWRALRRRLEPRRIVMLFLLFGALISFGPAVIGLFSGWNPAFIAVELLIYFIVQIAIFLVDDKPPTRLDIAVFVFGILTTSLMLIDQVQKADRLQSKQPQSRNPI